MVHTGKRRNSQHLLQESYSDLDWLVFSWSFCSLVIATRGTVPTEDQVEVWAACPKVGH